ncbi:hypothetical protein [Streptomyces sp. 4R-3d]|uniref:hypothetical protein n=1 Tax=Streptomyces sp. 4R-3d TaxID=2559605 RepID=UPI001071A442|nr:hypothetical protein [Streptomyces sp. 4R-3d]TFI30680.1 hypothetical protein E4P36_02690 [Streptomyces sp. 4R-3d]
MRDRSDMALGIVVGITSRATDNRVAVYVSGDVGSMVRLSEPYDLDLLARHSRPNSTGRRVLALVALALSVLAALYGCLSAHALGADWLLMFLSGLGGCTAVLTTYQWCSRLTGPRRFRV